MNVDQRETIQQDYETNTWLIKRLIADLSHEESVLQLPFPGNCVNWILGHILVSRHNTLQLLGAQPIWDQETLARYGSGSDPIRDVADGRRMEDLLQDVDETQHRIEAALRACRQADLERIAETDRGSRPVWQHVEGLHWHETYHMGQFQILRNYALSQRKTVE